MGYYKLDEIAGIGDDQGNMTCMECATEEEMAGLTEAKIISDTDVEDKEAFFSVIGVKKESHQNNYPMGKKSAFLPHINIS